MLWSLLFVTVCLLRQMFHAMYHSCFKTLCIFQLLDMESPESPTHDDYLSRSSNEAIKQKRGHGLDDNGRRQAFMTQYNGDLEGFT